jgi:hypothetical protein
VDTAQRQIDHSETDTTPFDSEPKRPVTRVQVDCPHIGIRSRPVGDRARQLARQASTDRIVGTQHSRPHHLLQVPGEALLDRLQRSVVVEMVGLDIREDRPVQRQFEVGAVALVGLDHEPLPAGPLRTRPHVGDIAADHEARA